MTPEDLESLVDWLRNAPSNEWCGAMLSKAADQIERLETENWQLKGALGYSVPSHIMPGPFKCGMCEARTLTIGDR